MRESACTSNNQFPRILEANESVSDYKDDGTNVLLDANENAYGPGLDLSKDGKLEDAQANGSSGDIDYLGLNRYPDP